MLLGSWLLARDELRYRGANASAADKTELRYHNVEPLEPLHILALLVAAVGHDVDHPGLNNAFLCASNDTLAMRYNDLSVLENHHAATTFEILAEKRCNMLATITPEQRKEVSSTCTHLNAHTRLFALAEGRLARPRQRAHIRTHARARTVVVVARPRKS